MTWRRKTIVSVLAATAVALTASMARADAVDRTALRVCADPNNLPFSNRDGEGFENRIAELMAAKLGVPVRYTWFPQAMGFIRNTLRAGKCDLVVGIASPHELLKNTAPYYRSVYALVARPGAGEEIRRLDDPRLKGLKIGVVAGTPPGDLLARYGLMANARPYPLVVDTRHEQPGQRMVEDVAAGNIDIGVLWGPIAGYYAKQKDPPLRVTPIAQVPDDMPMAFQITMGVRYREPAWKAEIDGLIAKMQPEIDTVLREYGVPLVDDNGDPISR